MALTCIQPKLATITIFTSIKKTVISFLLAHMIELHVCVLYVKNPKNIAACLNRWLYHIDFNYSSVPLNGYDLIY